MLKEIQKIDLDNPQVLQFERFDAPGEVACVRVALDGATIGEYWVEEKTETENYYVGTVGRKLLFGDTLPSLLAEMMEEVNKTAT